MLNTRVLFLGDSGVGKTTLLYLMKLDEIVTTIPTIGFNVEEIEYKNRKITFWDVGGNDKIKVLWKHYYENTKCIVYMMDISSKENLDSSIDSFNNIFIKQYKDNTNIPIVLFGNIFNDKIEKEFEEIIPQLNLPPEISPHVIKGNILKKEGISELLDYIYDNIEFIEGKEENKNEEKADEGENENENEKVKKEQYKVLMLGLDDSGKTKILYLLKLGESVLTIPSIGFNVEVIENDNWEKNITIWDLGGGEKIRPLWNQYFNKTNGLIWVYDINNNERIEESQNELIKLLDNSDLDNNLPLLIYANKSDLNINGNGVENFLDGIKDHLNNRPYLIKECNMNDVNSYKEGLDWLYNNIKEI